MQGEKKTERKKKGETWKKDNEKQKKMRGKIEKLESFDLHLQSRKKNEAKDTKGKRKLTKEN